MSKKILLCICTLQIIFQTIHFILYGTFTVMVKFGKPFSFESFDVEKYTIYIIYAKLILFIAVILTTVLACLRKNTSHYLPLMIICLTIDFLVTAAILVSYVITYRKDDLDTKLKEHYPTILIAVIASNGVIILLDVVTIISTVCISKSYNLNRPNQDEADGEGGNQTPKKPVGIYNYNGDGLQNMGYEETQSTGKTSAQVQEDSSTIHGGEPEIKGPVEQAVQNYEIDRPFSEDFSDGDDEDENNYVNTDKLCILSSSPNTINLDGQGESEVNGSLFNSMLNSCYENLESLQESETNC